MTSLRRFVWLALVLTLQLGSVAIATASVSETTPTPAPTCPPCARLGFVSVAAPVVDPPRPRVGDAVTLSFPINYYAAFPLSCEFAGACLLDAPSAYLAGDEPPTFDYAESRVVLRRRVVAAGTVTVRLDVSADTEDQCAYANESGGCSFYFTYAKIYGTSGDQPLELESGPEITPTPTVVSDRCDGDCDGDDTVLVDDLVRLIDIALGADVSLCAAGDRNGDLLITVDELTGAVNSILYGCFGELPDLVAVSARPTGCTDVYCNEFGCYPCGPYDFEVCVENRGRAVGQEIDFSLSGRLYAGALASIASEEAVCVHVPYGRFVQGEQLFEVDPDSKIADRDRDNNTITFPAPNPTGCDAICPPTPGP